MYVKCMQKFQNALDSVGMVGLCGLRSVQNRPIRTPADWLGQLPFSWGSRGREFESPQPDARTEEFSAAAEVARPSE